MRSKKKHLMTGGSHIAPSGRHMCHLKSPDMKRVLGKAYIIVPNGECLIDGHS